VHARLAGIPLARRLGRIEAAARVGVDARRCQAMWNVAQRTREREGTLTKMIESRTAQLPSSAYLAVAVGAMFVSWMFLLGGRRNVANFIGQWAPTILIMGLYNKLVKVEGSE
jgi:hypothetical protein